MRDSLEDKENLTNGQQNLANAQENLSHAQEEEGKKIRKVKSRSKKGEREDENLSNLQNEDGGKIRKMKSRLKKAEGEDEDLLSAQKEDAGKTRKAKSRSKTAEGVDENLSSVQDEDAEKIRKVKSRSKTAVGIDENLSNMRDEDAGKKVKSRAKEAEDGDENLSNMHNEDAGKLLKVPSKPTKSKDSTNVLRPTSFLGGDGFLHFRESGRVSSKSKEPEHESKEKDNKADKNKETNGDVVDREKTPETFGGNLEDQNHHHRLHVSGPIGWALDGVRHKFGRKSNVPLAPEPPRGDNDVNLELKWLRSQVKTFAKDLTESRAKIGAQRDAIGSLQAKLKEVTKERDDERAKCYSLQCNLADLEELCNMRMRLDEPSVEGLLIAKIELAQSQQDLDEAKQKLHRERQSWNVEREELTKSKQSQGHRPSNHSVAQMSLHPFKQKGIDLLRQNFKHPVSQLLHERYPGPPPPPPPDPSPTIVKVQHINDDAAQLSNGNSNNVNEDGDELKKDEHRETSSSLINDAFKDDDAEVVFINYDLLTEIEAQCV